MRGGEFEFNPRMHQPGAQTVIGKSYPEAGWKQGRAVLAALARHPATAKHIATKLARHFVVDEPPPALVERLTRRFLATQGDLKELAKALVTAPEAWEAPRAKLKRPGEWVVAALRAVGATPADIGPLMQAHKSWASRYGGRRRPRASPTKARPGSMGWRNASTSPINSPAPSAETPIRAMCSKRRSRRLLRTRRGRPSRAPRAARKRLRFCSWRRNSSAVDAHGPEVSR